VGHHLPARPLLIWPKFSWQVPPGSIETMPFIVFGLITPACKGKILLLERTVH
jgi:hypothetical protein